MRQGFIVGEPVLSPGLILRARRVGRPRADGAELYFAHGRTALEWIVRQAGLTEGVLFVPSYICREAVESLPALGQRIGYYPVGNGLEPDWEWIESQAGANGRALLLVHYFGFPNDLATAEEVCRRRRLLLIEDCAHSFLTRYSGRRVGCVGDAGIYSYRKVLPMPDGGGLVWRALTPEAAHQQCRLGDEVPWAAILRRVVKALLYRSRSPLWPRRPQWMSAADGAGPPLNGRSQRMSRISYGIMRTLEPTFPAIVARRRENYHLLSGALRRFPEVELVYRELPDDVCPYVLPARVRDRDRTLERLRAAGVAASSWPELPTTVVASSAFPVAARYGRELIVFPIHQDLTAAHIGAIAERYERVRAA